MFAIRRGNAWLLEKRPPTGIWGGLWSLPQGEFQREGDDNDAQAAPSRPSAARDARRVAAVHGLRVGQPRSLEPFLHAFTHFRLRIEPVLCEVAGVSAAAAPGAIWLPGDEVADAALPQPVKRLLLSPELLFFSACESTLAG